MQTNQIQSLLGERRGFMRSLKANITAIEELDRELNRLWGGTDAVATVTRSRSRSRSRARSNVIQHPSAVAATTQAPAARASSRKPARSRRAA